MTKDSSCSDVMSVPTDLHERSKAQEFFGGG